MPAPENFLAHADFVTALSRSLMRDRDRADDLAQDLWLAIVTRPPIGAGFAQAWISRVLGNLARRHQRSDFRRHRREDRATHPEAIPSPSEIIEREELRRCVVKAVLSLEEPYLSVVLYRYYEGLSVRQIAGALGVSTETVKTRLRRGLERLRVRLGPEHRWHGTGLFILPLEPLRPADLLPRVAFLTEGIAMIKKISASVVVVMTLSLATGIGIGRYAIPASSPAGLTTPPPDVVALARLDAEQKHLVEELQRENQHLEQALAAEKSRKGSAGSPHEGDRARQAVPPTETVESSQIDWVRLAAFFADNPELLEEYSQILTQEDRSIRDLSPEHLALYRDFEMEWRRAASHARLDTPYPFLDEEYLPDILGVVLGESLSLSASQLEALTRSAVSHLKEHAVPEDATPLEAYHARRQLITELLEDLPTSLDLDQQERWRRVEPALLKLLDGDRRNVNLGFRLGDEAVQDRMLHEWELRYQLDPEQKERARSIANQIAEAAKLETAHFDSIGEGQKNLSSEERARLNARFLEIQLSSESALLELLTDDQRARLSQQFAALFQFDDSRAILVDTVSAGGF